jgi:hypothetical protein
MRSPEPAKEPAMFSYGPIIEPCQAPSRDLCREISFGIGGRIEHLHRLGPAPLGYFLREVEAGASIPDHLERYARIDPAFVRALGGDRYAPGLHAIDGGRMRERQKL